MTHLLRGVSRAGLAGALLAPAAARAEGPVDAQPPLPALVAALDVGVMSRQLAWNDDLFGALRDYSLGAAPILGGELAIYPGAFVTRGRPAWLGIAGRAEGIVGASSRRSGHDDALPTHAWAFSAAVRGRLPLAVGAVWLDAGAAGRGFSIDPAGLTSPDFPASTFLGPRLGLGAELRLPASLAIEPRAGLARWTSAGDLSGAAWFPHARAWGVDAGLRLGWAARGGFAPYLELAWSRDVIALRPQPGDALVAGGVTDDRFALRLGVQWTLAGSRSR